MFDSLDISESVRNQILSVNPQKMIDGGSV